MTLTVRIQLGQQGMGAGRPLRTGMRPNWALSPGAQDVHDGVVTVVGADHIEPGDSGVVCVVPLVAASWQHVAVGDRVEVRVGSRCFGTGEVKQIVP